MTDLIHYVVEHGVPLVFLNVLLEQLGVPVPALPTLIIAGALTRVGRMSSTQVILAAVTASLAADYVWYLLGRRYGYAILKTLCRISLSPDSCVRDTEAKFERWGTKSLLFAKFIPGFSTIAPPLAGATKRGSIEFLIYDGIGAFLWAGAGVALGRLFHRQLTHLLQRLEDLGWWAVAIVAVVLALVVAVKWTQRLRFYRQLRVARISVHDLMVLLEQGKPVVLDVRSASQRQRDPRRIPTAILATADDIDTRLAHLPPDTEIILYCT